MEKQKGNQIKKSYHPYLDTVKKIHNPLLIKTPKIISMKEQNYGFEKMIPLSTREKLPKTMFTNLNVSSYVYDQIQSKLGFSQLEEVESPIIKTQESSSFDKDGFESDQHEIKQLKNARRLIHKRKSKFLKSSKLSSLTLSLTEDISSSKQINQANKSIQKSKQEFKEINQVELQLQTEPFPIKSKMVKLREYDKLPSIKKKQYPRGFNNIEVKGKIIRNLDQFPGVFKVPFPQDISEIQEVQSSIDYPSADVQNSEMSLNYFRNLTKQQKQSEENKIKLIKKAKRDSSPQKIENIITLKIPKTPHYYTFYDGDQPFKQKSSNKMNEPQKYSSKNPSNKFCIKNQDPYFNKMQFQIGAGKNPALALLKQPDYGYLELPQAYKLRAEPPQQSPKFKKQKIDNSQLQFYKMMASCILQNKPQNQQKYKVFKQFKYEQFNKQNQEKSQYGLEKVIQEDEIQDLLNK